MKLLDLFKTIIWAKNGDTTDFSQTNYEAGWAHLGDDTPTVQDFNYVQQMNDKKDQWLFKQLKAVMENAGIEPTEDNINALLNAILKIAKGHSTPKAINAETVDFVDKTGHTHSISKASLTQAGIVQLTNSLDSDSETLGLTAKAGKALKALINALTSNLQNYIPNSKKSNSVTSTSSDTVATSYAVKTAYDKAVDGVNKANAAQTAANNANNNANNRVSKEGDTVVGTIYLKRGSKKYRINNFDWSLLLEIDSNLDSLIGNNRCAIGFNNSGSLGLGGNAVDGWWAGINKSGLSVAKEITEGLTGKKLSESLPIPWLVGVPLPWMQSAVPAGFLPMQGQLFDKGRYPILAQRYPSGRLPDLRGEFIRGWDNGRGVDSGRSLLSNQGDAIRNISGSITNITSEGGIGVSGVFSSSYSSGGRAAGGGAGRSTAYFDVSRVVPTASENRPRNIAYQYICLAA
ncbi:tail fiber protein [Gallibacterium anatis]|uniref:tail fiber protein n=1 Tax=Gallibacterium anatis TaxID=750 RepID=UPI002549DEF5|nr:tail fiber protein [Gallibacterium anatis]WIM82263.1 tail fiber protein [Gallibacterium anatis]WIM82336.1 tail fiber protein [Gallibacterium anatis]